jgi:hypothetical protein
MEEQLIAGAREKQKALDASHAGELQKLVQEMDLRKAKELKELEDGLQRQIQVRTTHRHAAHTRVNRMNARLLPTAPRAHFSLTVSLRI